MDRLHGYGGTVWMKPIMSTEAVDGGASSPLHRGGHGFRGAVQVLFELKLEGLSDGTDDTLG